MKYARHYRLISSSLTMFAIAACGAAPPEGDPTPAGDQALKTGTVSQAQAKKTEAPPPTFKDIRSSNTSGCDSPDGAGACTGCKGDYLGGQCYARTNDTTSWLLTQMDANDASGQTATFTQDYQWAPDGFSVEEYDFWTWGAGAP
jgi:hypothetical protein